MRDGFPLSTTSGKKEQIPGCQRGREGPEDKLRAVVRWRSGKRYRSAFGLHLGVQIRESRRDT